MNTIIDPEIGIGIVDLGLIYKVEEKKGIVYVTMTLTTPMCPYGPILLQQINEEMKKIEGIKDVNVEMTFEPPWSPEKMNQELRYLLWGQ